MTAEKVEQPTQSPQSFDVPPSKTIPPSNENQRNQTLQPTSPPTDVTPSPNELHDLEGYEWEVEKMSDEELEQLRASYEKLCVKPSHAVQLELEKRLRNQNLEGRGDNRGLESQVEATQQLKPETSSAVSVHSVEPKPNNQTTRDTNEVPLPSSEVKAEVIEYGTMGHRFTAYFADLIVIYFIALIFYVLVFALKLPLTAEEGESQIVWFCILVLYMFLAQAVYHTTIGKYVHGLEVRSVKSNRKYPALWRILLRETLGRLFSSFFWGLGYWMALKKPKVQAWSDELAGTVVTVRPTNRVLVRALSAFILVAFILDVGLTGYGFYKEDRDKKYAALRQQMDIGGNAVVIARKAVDNALNTAPAVNTWADFAVWQGIMKSFKNDVDVYERRIDNEQQLIQRGISEDLGSEAEKRQLIILSQVYELRKQQAEKLRQEANLVVSCEPTQSSYAALRNDLQLIDSDIKGLNNKASQLLEEINVK